MIYEVGKRYVFAASGPFFLEGEFDGPHSIIGKDGYPTVSLGSLPDNIVRHSMNRWVNVVLLTERSKEQQEAEITAEVKRR